MIEHVPHGRWPSPVPTNTDRYRAWLVKMAAAAVNYGNAHFQFGPIFDPPYNSMPEIGKHRGF